MQRRDLSRRDFLASAALGVVACARGSENLDSRNVMRTDEALLYVGTYTEHTSSEGIYLVGMNPRTGQLRRLGSAKAGANPSFLAIHPNGGALPHGEVRPDSPKTLLIARKRRRARTAVRAPLVRPNGKGPERLRAPILGGEPPRPASGSWGGSTRRGTAAG